MSAIESPLGNDNSYRAVLFRHFISRRIEGNPSPLRDYLSILGRSVRTYICDNLTEYHDYKLVFIAGIASLALGYHALTDQDQPTRPVETNSPTALTTTIHTLIP